MTVLLLRAALIAGAVMTGLGALAPLLPQADMANHFRPYTLAGVVVVLGLAPVLRCWAAARWGAALAVLNVGLLLLPLLWSAETANGRALARAEASTSHRDIKIVTFNLYAHNREIASVAQFLLKEDADIVLLQEVSQQSFTALSAALEASYPHRHACLVPRACRQAIFAKRPWLAIENHHRSEDAPEAIAVLFDDGKDGMFSVHGLHFATPYRPRQARQVESLIARAGTVAGPMIVAGDLNMTPWSYRLQRLLAAAGLRRHATFLLSWPTLGQYRLPAPAFLIDHVLTTPDIKTVAIATGPFLGSDHLPIIATLRLPR